MKFFITGRSSRVDDVKRIIAAIEQKGHRVTFNWPPLPMVKPYEQNIDKAAEFSHMAIAGIIESDVYILLAHHDGTGVFAELGAALALAQLHGKPFIYAVASEIPPAMFHYHPLIIWVNSIEEVFIKLGI